MTGHEPNMGLAITMANRCRRGGGAPFGCAVFGPTGVVLSLSAGTGTRHDPTRHSEITAIREAALEFGGYLHGCTLYNTLEPCLMCCGAINHAKISRVVFGCYRTDLPDLFRRRDVDVFKALLDTSHPPEVHGGVRRDECINLFEGLSVFELEGRQREDPRLSAS